MTDYFNKFATKGGLKHRTRNFPYRNFSNLFYAKQYLGTNPGPLALFDIILKCIFDTYISKNILDDEDYIFKTLL